MGFTELQKRGVSGCNLLEIAGTQTGEHMQRVGGGREGAKQHEKPPGGEEEGIHISIFTRAQAATDAVEGWSSFFPGGEGSLQSLCCSPTSCTLPGQGREERRGCAQLCCTLKLLWPPQRRQYREQTLLPRFRWANNPSSTSFLCLRCLLQGSLQSFSCYKYLHNTLVLLSFVLSAPQHLPRTNTHQHPLSVV